MTLSCRNVFFIFLGLTSAVSAQTRPIEPIFAAFEGDDSPGCAVGIEHAAEPPVLRAFGSADLEHHIPISVDTVFEAGSVSKQFTAAATLLLVQQGKMALSDDVRKYLPELPDYGTPITIDQLLNHTSGLRDWGDVEAIAGWPRGSRLSLAEFTRQNFFIPLGMKHTQWRDDFKRIVPNRAIAYGRESSGYEQNMPFENAYGNGDC